MTIVPIGTRAKKNGSIISLPVDWVFPNPAQPRRIFGQDELRELAESISENGLLQPILVRKIAEKKYQLISGERRLMAVRQLGRDSIDAIVYDVESGASAVMALVENIHRKNLSFFEEARAISNLINIWGVSQEEAAKRIGKSQPAVANKLRLLKLSDEEKTLIEKSGLSERHARALVTIEDAEVRRQALRKIIELHLNVAQTDEYVKSLTESGSNGNKRTQKQRKICVVRDVRLFVNTINRAVDTMLCAGINASAETNESDEYIEYIVKIPKTDAYRRRENVSA